MSAIETNTGSSISTICIPEADGIRVRARITTEALEMGEEACFLTAIEPRQSPEKMRALEKLGCVALRLGGNQTTLAMNRETAQQCLAQLNRPIAPEDIGRFYSEHLFGGLRIV